jgi:signal transduction histidine kinase/CheY-like chemotaxis protein
VHPDDAANVAARWTAARETATELRLEHRIVLPGGVERHLRVWAAPLHDAGGEGGFVGSVEDETERRAAADRAQRRVRMESLGTLAGGVAHDFNNMLSVVLGYTDLARADADDGENVRVALEEIRTASLRARELVSQILTFSRQAEQERGRVDLTALVAESGRLLRAILPPHVEFTVRAPAEPVWVQGNVAALQQVIVNLCINAGHALRGVARPSIAVTLASGYEDAVPVAHLTVRDNGCGMSRAIADRIFEPFFTTKPVGEGTGMGLAVVHGTVVEHGGFIRVHSVPDVGTTFEIALPLATEAAEVRLPVRTPRPGAGRVLLVEDERAVARVLTRTLEHAGYTVIGSHDGLDALRLLDALQVPPDLVVSDVSMPRMSGDRLAEELAVRMPGLPVLLMTGFSRDVRLDGPVGGNVREVLQKPITSDQLLDAIARITVGAGAE